MHPNVIAEPWNRLRIPRPAIQSFTNVPLGPCTEKLIKEVVEKCTSVQTSLRSITLKTEIAALHSLLYIFHNRLSFHKPYLALKQVGQCIKRVESMGLDGSIKEILDLCPKYIGQNVSEKTQCCLVPSQPLLELASMKILGACKLLLRLLDCCCKAFHLCIQHLYFQEFIVLNLVLLGLLSRFWVLYRSILKKLILLYGAQYSLQQEVSSFQNMPYIKNFTFPAKMEDYLGPVFTDIAKTKLPKISSKKDLPKMLNKMFSPPDLNANARKPKKPAELNVPKAGEECLDLGKPVNSRHLNRGKSKIFDVKSLRKPLISGGLQIDNSSKVCRQASRTQNKLSVCGNRTKCIEHLLPRVEKTECFRDLCDFLQHAISWCKRRRFAAGAVFFRNKYLRSTRLMHVESHGYCLKNKLKHLKRSICYGLHQGFQNSDHTRLRLGSQSFQKIWRHKVTRSKKHKPQKSGLHINSHPATNRSDTEEPGMCSELGHVDLEESSAVTDTAPLPHAFETRKNDSQDNKVTSDTDDIDDIFCSIGI